MTPERWARIEALFLSALDLPPGERAALVERECGDDEAMLREVKAMLASHDRSDAFLEGPAVGRRPAEDDPEALVGAALDGLYRVEALVGRGGMGSVYRARHALLGDVVAIKVLPSEVSGNAALLRRFRREG